MIEKKYCSGWSLLLQYLKNQMDSEVMLHYHKAGIFASFFL